MSLSPGNDYRYLAAQSARSSAGKGYRRQFGAPLTGDALREMRRKQLEKMQLQVGDLVRYDFGGKTLDLRVLQIGGTWIITQSEDGRTFRFGGLDAFSPGVWEGNRSSVSAQIYRPDPLKTS